MKKNCPVWRGVRATGMAAVQLVRTPDGWAGTILFDLAATGQPKPSYRYDEEG